MKPPPLIALVLGLAGRYAREVYRGVARFARLHPTAFRFTLIQDVPSLGRIQPPPGGAIALVVSAEVLRAVRALRGPVVNVSGRLDPTGLPTVRIDDTAVGAMAAEHLLACGLRQFGFYACSEAALSVRRAEGFAECVRRAGFECHLFAAESEPPAEQRTRRQRRRSQQWLRELPKPVGILALTDWAAAELCEDCAELGLRVGEEVALVGVDNDDLHCETCNPPLSSVDTSPERVGQEAAALMARLLRGGRPPSEPILVPPVAVVQRQSSDLLAVADPHLAAALRYVREHVDQPLTVEEVARQVPLSRRVLERRFREHLGRTALSEIHRAKIERIKQLLIATDQTTEEIAEHCGFAQLSHMAAFFRKKTGFAPGAFRKQFRHKAGGS